MPLVNAKCTNCGANLTVDESKDTAICEFCGSAYIVEKAVQNYQNVNSYQGHVVNVYNIYQNSNTAEKAEQNTVEKAEKEFDNIPDDIPLCYPVRVSCIKGFDRISGFGLAFDLTAYKTKLAIPFWKKREGKIDYKDIVSFRRVSRGFNPAMSLVLNDGAQYTLIFKKRDMDAYNKCAELIEADLNKRLNANT